MFSAFTPPPIGTSLVAMPVSSPPKETFFVRVSGSSMIDAGINDGDLLIVDRQQTVVNGKIVIAVVNGDLTVKRIFMEKDKVILYPENFDKV